MGTRDELKKLRDEERRLPPEERAPVRIKREVIRAAVLQEEGVPQGWEDEDDTGVHELPTMEELNQVAAEEQKEEHVKKEICKKCRDRYCNISNYYCDLCFWWEIDNRNRKQPDGK